MKTNAHIHMYTNKDISVYTYISTKTNAHIEKYTI